MHNFKPGDKVIFKDYNPNESSEGTARDLTAFGENFVFTVSHHGTGLLHLEEYLEGAFPERFILAGPYLQQLEAKKLLGLK